MHGVYISYFASFWFVFVRQSAADQNTNQDCGINDKHDNCTLKICNYSAAYFQSRLAVDKPNLIYFHIHFNGTKPNSSKEAFYPFKWIWTYATSKSVYPYMHWGIDYDIFSFNLLDVKTIGTPEIIFFPSENCNLTLGTPETTELIAKTLGDITPSFDKYGFNKYQTSYWCYLAEDPGIRKTVKYFLGLYLNYPIAVMKYNCCTTRYCFKKAHHICKCLDKQMEIWPQCTLIPFTFGILLFLYCPIPLLNICTFLSKNEKLLSENSASRNSNGAILISTSEEREHSINLHETDDGSDNNWIFLDGTPPITFTGLFRGLFDSANSISISRIRRLICVLIAPTMIYIKLTVYGRIQFKTTNDLMDRGVPFGFLSLIAKTTRGRSISFVPAFGGPITIVLAFYVFSIIFFVIPSSLKRIFQLGLPVTPRLFAPLCYSADEVKEMAKINVKDDPGYANASNYMKCSFFMVFRSDFWKRCFICQKIRFQQCMQMNIWLPKAIFISLLPFYIIVCLMELVIAVIYYAFPMFSLVVIIVRGTIFYLGDKMSRGGRYSESLLNSRFYVAAAKILMTILATFYAYSVYLVVIESFIFLSEFFVYSYLAVIIYPSVAFGYLFFAVVLGYYIIRLIRGFGNKYLDLLNDVVDISLDIDQHDNHVTNFDGNLIISNVKIRTIKSIKINGTIFHVPVNMRERFSNVLEERQDHVRFQNEAYGIRRDLFDYVITKHMPVHQQMLRVFFQLALIVFMLLFTLSVTSGSFTGPTSQITEVMHVIFIVTIGALPRVLEVAMSDSSEHIERELKMRKLERTICQFWKERESNIE